jgi:hypothetical protein
MTARHITLALSILLVFVCAGCRTGEYPVDHEIYSAMPGVIAQHPELAAQIAKNEDGSLKMTFEKGVMSIWVELGLDEDSRRTIVSNALQLFHEQYMTNPNNKKENGSWVREVIGCKGYVEDTELYVIEWNLNEERPNVTNDRYGNFV